MAATTSYVPLVGPGTIRVMMPSNGSERLLARIVYPARCRRRSSRARRIGKLKVWRGDELALEVPLTAAEDVGTGNMSPARHGRAQPN